MKVLLALDDSPTSKHMLDLIVKRHWPADTQFKIVHVIEPIDIDFAGNGWLEMQEDINNRRHKRAEKLCDDARHRIEHAIPDAIVHYDIRSGRPHAEILVAAADWGAQRILVGAHSREICPHNLLGSVSRAVAERAHCTVEVFRSHPGHVLRDEHSLAATSKN